MINKIVRIADNGSARVGSLLLITRREIRSLGQIRNNSRLSSAGAAADADAAAAAAAAMAVGTTTLHFREDFPLLAQQ